MATCEVCGNDYQPALEITHGDRSGTFDSLECAAHEFAPTCATCGVRILGHGTRRGGQVYCCTHCAEQAG